jgi:ABC-2 type transport system permease protein/oleandomycin transport system permease protein
MTTTEATPAPTPEAFEVRQVRPKPVADALTITWRNLLNIRRNPQLLVFATIQPIVFVLMFRYVFGGSIIVPGYSHYVDYLMPGIFVQTVVFGSLTTGVGLADDLQKGLIERFRSLPMARSAVLVGRTLADLLRNIFVVLLMSAMGFIVGWHVSTNAIALVAGLGLVVAFAYSLSWVFAIVGMYAPNGETAQAASFPILAPLVFASSAFVSVDRMPGPLRAFAKHQPVTIVVDAVRNLTHGGPTTSNLLQSIAWIIAIVAVCAPIAVAKYRRSV